MKHIKTWMLSLLLMMTSLPLFAQTLEYWFDNRVSSRRTVSIRGDEATETFDIPTSSLTQGLHWLHFRVHDSSGYSGISSSPFFKYDPSTGNQIEYWFDGDYNQHVTADLSASADNLEALLNLRSNIQFPIGFHQLNYRFGTAAGMAGPIYSAFVMKVGGGEPSYLEYWIDEDKSHSKTVEGTITSDGEYSIIADLDLNDVAPGFHRLYYRASSQSSHTVGAVSMTPIMVKSMYAPDTENLKVTAYEYWVDNDMHTSRELVKKAGEVIVPDNIDMRKYGTGAHRINIRAKNSANLWSSAVSADIDLAALNAPSITLIATPTVDGLVKIEYNTIPNDHSSIIYRKKDGEKEVRVKKFASSYPNKIVEFDNPGTTGTYTYYAKSAYLNANNESVHVTSNEATITLGDVRMESDKVGTIIGYITLDDQMFGTNTGGRELDVKFSDGVTIKTQNLRFMRTGIEIGKKLSISVAEDEYYTYSSAQVTVAKQNDNVQLTGTSKKQAEKDPILQPVLSDIDWVISSRIEFDEKEKTYSFKIKSNTGKTWSGVIAAYAILRGTEDVLQGDETNYVKKLQSIAKKVDTDYVLGSGEKSIKLSVESLIAAIDGVYDIYFLSIPTIGQDKPLGFDESVNAVPLAYNVKGLGYDKYMIESGNPEYVAEKVINWIASSTALDDKEKVETAKKKLKERGIDFDKELTSSLEIIKLYNEEASAAGWKKLTITNAITWLSGIELTSKDKTNAEIEKQLAKSICKYVDKGVKDAKTAKDYINYAKDVYKLLHQEDMTSADYRKMYFKYCKKLAGWGAMNSYLAGIYSLYFECGEKMANKVIEYGNKLYDNILSDMIITDTDKFTFRIFLDSYGDDAKTIFYSDHYSNNPSEFKIKRITGSCTNSYGQSIDLEFSCDRSRVVENGSNSYFETTISKVGTGTMDIAYNLTEFWMDIEFTNGQIVHVPLHLHKDINAISRDGLMAGKTLYTIKLEEDIANSVYYIKGQKPEISWYKKIFG